VSFRIFACEGPAKYCQLRANGTTGTRRRFDQTVSLKPRRSSRADQIASAKSDRTIDPKDEEPKREKPARKTKGRST
jgi:hypothetical protein